MASVRHIIGLLFAVALFAGLWWAWETFRTDLRSLHPRDILRHADWFVALLIAFFALSLADKAWGYVARAIGKDGR